MSYIRHVLGYWLSIGRSYAQEHKLRRGGRHTPLCNLSVCNPPTLKDKFNQNRSGATKWKFITWSTCTLGGDHYSNKICIPEYILSNCSTHVLKQGLGNNEN